MFPPLTITAMRGRVAVFAVVLLLCVAVVVPASAQGLTNYALPANGGVCTAIGYLDSNPLYHPSNGCDGDESTWWSSGVKMPGPWLRADLGQVRVISLVSIVQRTEVDRSTQIRLETSVDGTVWTQQYLTSTGLAGGRINIPLDPAVSSRYWRIVSVAGNSGYGWTVQEWEIKGDAVPTPTATSIPTTPTSTPPVPTPTGGPTPTPDPGCTEVAVGFPAGPSTLALAAGVILTPVAGDVWISAGGVWVQLPAGGSSVDVYGGAGSYQFYGDGYIEDDNGTPFLLPSRLSVCDPPSPTPTMVPPVEDCGLIINCSFESGLNAWTVYGSPGATADAERPIDGSFALRVNSAAVGGVAAGVRQTFSVDPSVDYLIEGWIAGSGFARLTGAGFSTDTWSNGNSSYAKFSEVLAIGAGVTELTLSLEKNFGSNPDPVYFDYLTLVPWGEASPTPTPPGPTPTGTGGLLMVDCVVAPEHPECIQVGLQQTIIALQRTQLAKPDEAAGVARTIVALQQTQIAGPGGVYVTPGPAGGNGPATLGTAVAAVCAREPCYSAGVVYTGVGEALAALEAASSAPDCHAAVVLESGGPWLPDTDFSAGFCAFLEMTATGRELLRWGSVVLFAFLLWRYVMATVRRVGDV